MFLRQSTSQVIRFGPFLDSTDGITPETGLTIAQADMQLSKDGAAFAQKNAAGNASHDIDGWYSTTLDTTDTGTTGDFKIQVNVAGSVPVWVTYFILTSSAYDSLQTGTFNNLGGTAQTADHTAAIADIPTVSEFNARTIVSANYALEASVQTIDTNVDAILVDTNDLQTNQGNWLTATGFSTFNPAIDTVATVTTVTNMRGTDSALLASSYTAPDNAGITQTQTDISNLNDISVTEILTTQMTESYAADGVAPTLAQGIFLTMQNLQDFSFTGTTQTVKKLDGTSTAATYTLDDALAPTSKTRAT